MAEASPAPELAEDVAAPSSGADVGAPSEPASSSDATAGESREDLLSVVSDAIRPEGEPAPEDGQESGSHDADVPTEDSPQEAEPASAEPEGEDDGERDVSDEDLPFGKHPRFRKLLDERNRYKADSEQYERVTSFIESNGMAAEDAANALRIGALVKQAQMGRVDPRTVIAEIDSFRNGLMQMAGLALPDDIQARVTDGSVDPESAAELARQRAVAVAAERRANEATQQAEQDRFTAGQQRIAGAIADWERDTRTRDPDYDRKALTVERFTRAIVSEHGPPQDVAQAIELIERAYKEAGAALGTGAPRPTASKPQPSASASSASSASPPQGEPKSLLEVAERALQETRS